MSATSGIWREAFRTQERGLDWRSGLAGAVATVGPLAIGVGIDHTAAGLTAAIGGLNTALCVPRADLTARLWWGSLAALGGVAALAAAGAANGGDAILIVVTLAWVAFWALLRADGPTGALTGFAIAAVFVILAGVPETAPLGQRVGWFALGAFPSLALMVVARRGSTQSPPVGRRALRAVRTALVHDTALQVHAVRLALAVGAGTLIYRLADLPHGYWVPLTTLAIVQPTEHDTFLRSIQRSAGTLAAGALILAITLATDHRWPLLALAAASAFLLYALDDRGYFWLVLLITPTALLLFSTVDFQGDTVAVDRVGDSMLGIAIGLAIGELARAQPFVRLVLRLQRRARQPDARSWR